MVFFRVNDINWSTERLFSYQQHKPEMYPIFGVLIVYILVLLDSLVQPMVVINGIYRSQTLKLGTDDTLGVGLVAISIVAQFLAVFILQNGSSKPKFDQSRNWSFIAMFFTALSILDYYNIYQNYYNQVANSGYYNTNIIGFGLGFYGLIIGFLIAVILIGLIHRYRAKVYTETNFQLYNSPGNSQNMYLNNGPVDTISANPAINLYNSCNRCGNKLYGTFRLCPKCGFMKEH